MIKVKIEDLRSLLRKEIYLVFYDQFQGTPKEELDLQINECLKYLYLASSHKEFSGSFLPVAKAIDDVWHYLIIQTRDYADLCQKLPGKVFIHHQSIHFTEFSMTRSRADIMKMFLSWVTAYTATFGPFPKESEDYWLMVKFLKKIFGMSMEAIYEATRAQPLTPPAESEAAAAVIPSALPHSYPAISVNPSPSAGAP